MKRIAVILVGTADARLFASATSVIAGSVTGIERLPDGSFRVALADVEHVVSVLDRLGFVWATDKVQLPRTWAERMFAEVPERLWGAVNRSLTGVLAGRDGDPVSLSVLRLAHQRASDTQIDRSGHAEVQQILERTSRPGELSTGRNEHPSEVGFDGAGTVLRFERQQHR